MEGEAFNKTLSQQRIPDSRLPGAENTYSGTSEAKENQQSEVSPLALWPIIAMLALALSFTIAVICYGPTEVLRWLLQNIVPPEPDAKHGFAIWGLIVLCITLGIPVLLLLLPVPAIMFGFWKGLPITFTAEMTAAFMSFVLGRYVACQPVRALLKSKGCMRAMRFLSVMEEEEEGSMQLLVLYRFLIIPMAIRNYGPSVLQVPLAKLVLAAIPHSMWSAIVFAVAGSTLKEPAQLLRDGRKITWRTPQWQEILGMVVALISFVFFSWIAWRAYSRRLAEEERRWLQPAMQHGNSPKDSEEGGEPANYGSNLGSNS